MNNTVTSTNDTTKPSSSQFPRSQSVTYAVVSVAKFLVIVSGNALVVAVFTTASQLRQRKSYWLTISLAVADLMTGILGGPSWLYGLGFGLNLWEWQPEVNLVANAAFLFVSYASLMNLTVVALERAYATLWPLKYRVLSSRGYHVMIGLSWTLPLFFPLLDLAQRHKFVSAAQLSYTCFFLQLVSIFTVILSCYVSIWFKIKFRPHPQNHVTTAQERKLTASLLLVTAVSIVTWLPAVVFSTAFNAQSLARMLSEQVYLHIYICLSLLFFANSLVNPLIYSFRMPQFRQEVSRLCRRRTNREIQLQEMEMANRPAVMNADRCVTWFHSEVNMAMENPGFNIKL